MLTPARRHFESVMAQNRGTAANTLADLTAYEQMLHRLRVDKNRLKGIQNKKIKAVVKREILPNYQGWIDGVLASDSGQADEVFTTAMLWNIDAGNVAEALRLGEYAIRHKLSMGDNFDRTPAVVLVDEISDPVLAHFKAGQADVPVSADLLKGLDGLTANEDVPEPVRAKLWKAIGYTLRTRADTQAEALDYLRKAIAEFSDIGVKRDIENLERLVKAAAAVSGEGDSAEIPRSAVTAVTVIEGEAVPLADGPVVLSSESGNAAAEVTELAAESSAAEPAAKPPAKRGRPAGTKAAAAKKTSGVAKARTGAAKTAKPQ
ncbi:phage terminase small subunit [Erwiniaceae bacterium L1_54_6]|nr:phage terminase small subunit [Erwiniaceae bacterium L1_54_6]